MRASVLLLFVITMAATGCVTKSELTPEQKATVSTLQSLVLGARGQTTAAIDRASFAIAENPLYAPAYILRGALWLKEGEAEFALKDADFAAKIAPKNPDVHNLRGAIAMKQDDLPVALKEFTEAIELNPGLSMSYTNRGGYWIYVHDFDRAMQDLDTAIRLNEKNPMALRSRSLAWMAKGEFGKASHDLSRAQSLEPANSGNYANQGLLHLLEGAPTEAIASFDKAIKHDPDNSQYFAARGRAWLLLGNNVEALEDFRRADSRSRTDPYLPLLTYLGMRANGLDGQTYLAERRTVLMKKDTWPRPLYDLLLGTATPAAVMKAADQLAPYRAEQYRCEASYFIGQNYKIRHQETAAVEYFQKALAAGPRIAFCHSDARLELEKRGVLDQRVERPRRPAWRS